MAIPSQPVFTLQEPVRLVGRILEAQKESKASFEKRLPNTHAPFGFPGVPDNCIVCIRCDP